MHQENPRARLPARRRVRQVQDHVAEAALQTAGQGQSGAEEVLPCEQEGLGSVCVFLGAEGEVDEAERGAGQGAQEDLRSDGGVGAEEV